MRPDIDNKPIREKFQHLLAVISGQRFLKKQGLGNEIPFFICPFKPEEAIEMERLQRQLVSRLEQNGIRVLEINLYDLSIKFSKVETKVETFGRRSLRWKNPYQKTNSKNCFKEC